MIVPSLLDHTRARFPDFLENEIEVTPLEKGGSDRKFYRVATGADCSIILVKYDCQKEENRHYVSQARFLADHGVHVPGIYHHDPEEGLIWMQDLGEIDLWAHRQEPWEKRRIFYEWTLQQAAQMHAVPLRDEAEWKLQPAFDERLYLWEQHYFLENCLGRHFQIEAQAVDPEPFIQIAEKLAALPRVLVHRDFQSQNVMISEGAAWLIDFQGMRPGLRQYDLASLLYDPYVTLSAAERRSLLRCYETLCGIQDPAFGEIFALCAVQRLLQALGAYGFLGYVKGKPDFLKHIPAALASLREVVAEIPALEPFGNLLKTLPA